MGLGDYGAGNNCSKSFCYNENYTTMEFVVKVLMQVFQRRGRGRPIMLSVHNRASALRVYTAEVAELKFPCGAGRQTDNPLKCR